MSDPEVQAYRKKPVVILAAQFTVKNAKGIAAWCAGKVTETWDNDESEIAIHVDIPTLEGVMRADEGDFIIKGVKDEFYPCKPDIFEATYELA